MCSWGHSPQEIRPCKGLVSWVCVALGVPLDSHDVCLGYVGTYGKFLFDNMVLSPTIHLGTLNLEEEHAFTLRKGVFSKHKWPKTIGKYRVSFS